MDADDHILEMRYLGHRGQDEPPVELEIDVRDNKEIDDSGLESGKLS